jgi:hypothetical protein
VTKNEVVGGELVSFGASLRKLLEEYRDERLSTGENQVGSFKMIFTYPALQIACPIIPSIVLRNLSQ